MLFISIGTWLAGYSTGFRGLLFPYFSLYLYLVFITLGRCSHLIYPTVACICILYRSIGTRFSFSLFVPFLPAAFLQYPYPYRFLQQHSSSPIITSLSFCLFHSFWKLAFFVFFILTPPPRFSLKVARNSVS